MTLKRVVLPAPLGPDQAENLARLDGEVDAAERRKAAEVLADSRKLEECHGLRAGECGTPR